MIFLVIAFLWIVEAAQSLFILYHCVLAIFLILKNCQVSVIFCHCFSLNSGSCSIAVYFVIRWCPGHLCFLHQVFFHRHSLAWFYTRFLHQVFFLWYSWAWFCTRFKLWKWNCSAIWHNLSSFGSNLHQNCGAELLPMHKKWETVLSKREHSFMGHSHWKISRSVLFFVIAFLWIMGNPLNCCLFCIIVSWQCF